MKLVLGLTFLCISLVTPKGVFSSPSYNEDSLLEEKANVAYDGQIDDSIRVFLDVGEAAYTTDHIVIDGTVSKSSTISIDFANNDFSYYSYEIDDELNVHLDVNPGTEARTNGALIFSDGTNSTEVYIYALRNEKGVYLSQNSFEQCDEHYHLEMYANGDMTEEEFDAWNLTVQGEASENTTHGPIIQRRQGETAPNYPIIGNFSWRHVDDDDKEFGVAYTYVKLYGYRKSIFAEPIKELLADGYTTYNGVFSYTPTSPDRYQDYAFEIFASGEHTAVKRSIVFNDRYSFLTDHFKKNANTSTICNVVFEKDNDGNPTRMQRVMCASQALIYGERYANAMSGKHWGVDCCYPYGSQDGAYYNPAHGIYLGENEYEAWDVILHEYGHRLQVPYGLTNGAFGEHVINDTLMKKHTDLIARNLAWNEAWPTVFGNLVTRYYKYDLQDIPGVNDNFYDDATWRIDLETFFDNEFGEACELNIIQIMLDIFDSYNSSESYDRCEMTHKQFWDLVTGSPTTNFSTFIGHCRSNPNIDEEALNEILMKYRIACRGVEQLNTGSVIPTFYIPSYNYSYSDNAYVIYVDMNGNELGRQHVTKSTGSFSPSSTLWEKIYNTPGDQYGIYTIVGRGVYAAYKSNIQYFDKPVYEKTIYYYPGSRIESAAFVLSSSSIATIKINITFDHKYLFETMSNGIDTVMELYNSDGTQIESDDDDGYQNNSFILRYLTRGTYYLKIRTWGTRSGGNVRMIMTSPENTIHKNFSYDPVYSLNDMWSITSDNYDFYTYISIDSTYCVRYIPQSTGKKTIRLFTEFDSYVYVLDPRKGTVITTDEYNDDGAPNCNAKLVIDVTKDVPYLIICSQYNPDNAFANLDSGDDLRIAIRNGSANI